MILWVISTYIEILSDSVIIFAHNCQAYFKECKRRLVCYIYIDFCCSFLIPVILSFPLFPLLRKNFFGNSFMVALLTTHCLTFPVSANVFICEGYSLWIQNFGLPMLLLSRLNDVFLFLTSYGFRFNYCFLWCVVVDFFISHAIYLLEKLDHIVLTISNIMELSSLYSHLDI